MTRIDISNDALLGRVMPITESGCWIWMGEIAKSHGYGIVNGPIGNGKRRDYAHRIFHERFKGPIPEGLTIDHLCRVRCCVNPDHLDAVPIGINVLRGESNAAKHAKKTHCIHGHPLTSDNLVPISTRPRYRMCRHCANARHEAKTGKPMKHRSKNRICIMDGCEDSYYCNGLCRYHYRKDYHARTGR